MKLGSQFINSLDNYSSNLNTIDCKSYFCSFDLMVFPGFRAVLPIGNSVSIPVYTHKSLIKNKQSIDIIAKDLLDVFA